MRKLLAIVKLFLSKLIIYFRSQAMIWNLWTSNIIELKVTKASSYNVLIFLFSMERSERSVNANFVHYAS